MIKEDSIIRAFLNFIKIQIAKLMHQFNFQYNLIYINPFLFKISSSQIYFQYLLKYFYYF